MTFAAFRALRTLGAGLLACGTLIPAPISKCRRLWQERQSQATTSGFE